MVEYDEQSKNLSASIHYKYLFKKNVQKPYVHCVDGSPCIDDYRKLCVKSLCEVTDIVYWTGVLAGSEKTGVHRILQANSNILDVEIALSGEDLDDDEKDSKIDFCALQSEAGQFYIRFFEAKHYSYAQALFAADALEPPVIGQLRGYQEKLQNNREGIEGAYKNLIRCANQLEGKNILGQFRELSDVQLRLDTEPRLVVFGYDQDQKDGDNFRERVKKLKAYLEPPQGSKRLLAKGSAKDFATGISKGYGFD